MHSQLQIPRMTMFNHLNDVIITNDPQSMTIIFVYTANSQGEVPVRHSAEALALHGVHPL